MAALFACSLCNAVVAQSRLAEHLAEHQCAFECVRCNICTERLKEDAQEHTRRAHPHRMPDATVVFAPKVGQ